MDARLHPHNDAFWKAETPRQARDHLVDALRIQLIGPVEAEEEIQESPLTHYVSGQLAPFGTDVPEEERDRELDAAAEGEDEGEVGFGPPVSQALTPSSIGLSFLVAIQTQTVKVTARWGDYHVEDLAGEDQGQEQEDDPAESPTSDSAADEPDTEPKPRRRQRSRWLRIPRQEDELLIELKPGAGLQRIEICADGVTIEHLTRAIDDRLAVSLFLVNRRDAERGTRPPVNQWMFQPELTVTGAQFLPRELEPALAHTDRDLESNRLLFRNRREFAIGHGCAAEWTVSEDAPCATAIRTELMPQFELPKVEPRDVGAPGLDMQLLARAAGPAEVRTAVEPLLTAYRDWINGRRSEIRALKPDLQGVADAHLKDCEEALARMDRGLSVLDHPDAFEAFRFANRAMLLQRAHTVWSRQRRDNPASAPEGPTYDGKWRPFQLAFILLNLDGLARPEGDDRGIGDLLWFPTGGGKTEAYLGLAAFSLALRRRRSVPGVRTDGGVAVLMRYTLRLLTIQQFQRAATLVCACEFLRRKDTATWGERRFSLGLWLGMGGTPNTHDDARRELSRVQQDPAHEGVTPCVLESCPWCGEKLTPSDYWSDGEALRTRVACSRRACAFHKSKIPEGIPVVVVDEEIYRECPSMLIGTVDKFAQMPWNGDVQALFGFVNRECDRCGFLTAATAHSAAHRRAVGDGGIPAVRETEPLAPPELVIQDELHLISGPLGTLVGLYETAVDFLSSRRYGTRMAGPKVIASTATVRRAFEQVQGVFDRTLRVFPPPGLDPQDSFFAVERNVSEEAPGRLYIGVCAPGKSMKTAYVRVAASLLSSGAGLRAMAKLAEPYLTLVSYFNSLRELGGAIRLVDDDIPARLEQLKNAGLPRRQRPVYMELTSRVRQSDIPFRLRRLERRHDAPGGDDTPLPLDVVLASNMISVGVDVDRLGLMSVTGQPKTTAEYIQATSRVGRQDWGPGLVVTIYNWSRPRDLSHYERFRHYHRTLYRSVEAVSATPFSSRALDKGLRGVFVAMARLGSQWSVETAAGQFDPGDRRVLDVLEAIHRRASTVADPPTAAAVNAALKGLADEWWGLARKPLRYGWRSPDPSQVPTEDVLLRMPEGGWIGHWPAPQSLREVEEQSFVRVMGLDA